MLINLFQGGGIYSYTGSANAAFSNWVFDVYGINLGDGLTGKHYASFTQVTDPITGVGKDDFWDNDYAGFVEDSWKVRPNLTVNMGVRYELQHVPQPPKPNTATPLLTHTDFQDQYRFQQLRTAHRPRLSAHQERVVRAGYGMFYGKTPNSTFYAIRVENGVYQTAIQLRPDANVRAGLPERDLHASRAASRGAFPGREGTAGDQYQSSGRGWWPRTGSRPTS